MRYPIRFSIRDGIGRVLAGSTVTVYDSGTLTPSILYAASVGGAAIAGAVLTADVRGQAVGYLDDANYPLNQLFDAVIAKADHETVTVPDIMP